MTDAQVALRSARTAFIGAILGALIGGIGTFAGTYVSTKTQKDQQVYDRTEAAYVGFLTQGERYRQHLIELQVAVSTKDQRKYASERALLTSEGASLYATAVLVDLIAVSGKTNPVLDGFYSYNPPTTLGEADKDKIADAIKKGSDAEDEFEKFARSDLKQKQK